MKLIMLMMVGVMAWGQIISSYGTDSYRPRTEIVAPPSGGGIDLVADIEGEPDNRPGIWGKSGYQDVNIRFFPPIGHRTKILSVIGSMSSFVNGLVPPGTHAGVSWGIITTKNTNTATADFINPNCLVYIKQSLGQKDTDTSPIQSTGIVNGLLDLDNVMVTRSAVYLNTTGLPIHVETAIVITYQFVKE